MIWESPPGLRVPVTIMPRRSLANDCAMRCGEQGEDLKLVEFLKGTLHAHAAFDFGDAIDLDRAKCLSPLTALLFSG